MTGDKNKFVTLNKEYGGLITFGDYGMAQIKGIGTISKFSSTQINNVYYIKGLKQNHLSISQLFDNGYEVVFQSIVYVIRESSSGKILFSCLRVKNIDNTVLEDLSEQTCFASFEND